MSGSYGSLGLLTAIKLKLIPAKKYVLLEYIPVKRLEILKLMEIKSKQDIDFFDGIIFDRNKAVIIIGKFIDQENASLQTFRKAADPWFYMHAEKITRKNERVKEVIPLVDYLFRYDRGAFWMGDYFFKILKIPGGNNFFTRFIFNNVLHTRKMYEGLHKTHYDQQFFIQDFYVPLKNTKKILDYVKENLEIYPLWLCPLRSTKNPEKLSPNYISGDLILDIGIWGQTEKTKANPVDVNKEAEKICSQLGGRKMLYAHAYYTLKEFWKIYDQKWYKRLREEYHAEKVFPDIYEKTHVSGKNKPALRKGIFQMIKAVLKR